MAPAYLLQLRDDLDRLEAKSVRNWSDVVVGLTSLVLFGYVVLGHDPPVVAVAFAVLAALPLVQILRAERQRHREMRAIRSRIDRIENPRS